MNCGVKFLISGQKWQISFALIFFKTKSVPPHMVGGTATYGGGLPPVPPIMGNPAPYITLIFMSNLGNKCTRPIPTGRIYRKMVGKGQNLVGIGRNRSVF